MNKRYKKPLIIAGLTLLLIILMALFTGVGDKLGKLVTIGGNIATNLMHAEHGDTRDLDKITVEYIKEHTGSSAEVNVDNLPKALKPLKKVKHPPFSMGACPVCHAPKRSKPAAILTRTVDALCYKCHEPVGQHQKIDCNKCHNPHHSDRKELLRDTVTEEKCPIGDFQR